MYGQIHEGMDVLRNGDKIGKAGETLGQYFNVDSDTLRLREEQLQASKTPVETGRVTLGKEVVEEEKTMGVPVSRQEVLLERHPVQRRPADQPIGSGDQTIDVPVREERLEVEKEGIDVRGEPGSR